MSFNQSFENDGEKQMPLRHNRAPSDFDMTPAVDFLSYEPNFLFKENSK